MFCSSSIQSILKLLQGWRSDFPTQRPNPMVFQTNVQVFGEVWWLQQNFGIFSTRQGTGIWYFHAEVVNLSTSQILSDVFGRTSCPRPWSDKGWKPLAQHWKPWKPLNGHGDFAFYHPFLSYNMLHHVGSILILQAPKAIPSCSKVEGPTSPLSAAIPWSSEQKWSFRRGLMAEFWHLFYTEGNWKLIIPCGSHKLQHVMRFFWCFWKNILAKRLSHSAPQCHGLPNKCAVFGQVWWRNRILASFLHRGELKTDNSMWQSNQPGWPPLRKKLLRAGKHVCSTGQMAQTAHMSLPKITFGMLRNASRRLTGSISSAPPPRDEGQVCSLGLSQGASNVWPREIQLKAVNILAKAFSPFFCQSSLNRKQKESKTAAWRDFCKRTLLKLKGETCQHLRIRIFVTKSLSADWCLHAQTFWRIPVFSSVAERQAQLPPQLATCDWTGRCQHLGKGTEPCFCQSSSKRKQRESKTTAWRDFCERTLLKLKGGTCQHLRIRIFVTKSLRADWYLPAWTNLFDKCGTWQCRREAGAVAPAFG